MYAYFLVFIGGGLGSMCRYGISHLLKVYQLEFPLATFLANVLSCFVLGFMVGLSLKEEMGIEQRMLIMTGFCGGFSTFSTFTNETFQLMQNAEYGYASLNIFGSLLVCGLFIYLGIRAAG